MLVGAGGKKCSTREDTKVNEVNRTNTLTGETQDLSPTQHGPPKKLPSCAGTLARLSMSMRQHAQSIATMCPLLLIYDNINMMWKVAEQVIGRTGELSTTVTITAS